MCSLLDSPQTRNGYASSVTGFTVFEQNWCGHLYKTMRLISPSTHTPLEVAQEGSSNEEEYKPSRVTAAEGEDGQSTNSVIGTYSTCHRIGGSDLRYCVI